jgi:hypothetical protein
MAVDADVLEQIRERLRVSTRVGDDRIEVATRDDDVVLLGAVASPEESTVASQLDEEYATSVVNELQIDRGLREGFDDDPLDTEPASPAGDEVLIGSTDMLAGPDASPTEDLAEALDENEPWSPPDVPQLAPTATEQRGGWARENALALSEWEEGGDPDDLLDEEDRAARDGVSAPDLAPADLERAAEGGQLPSLDPTAATPGGDPEAEPEPFESGTWADDMVEQVPGTAKGPGAVGEYETEGGELGSVPALETGAIGADTAAADPARDASGGTQKIAGTDRGPSAPDDRAVREEIEDG